MKLNWGMIIFPVLIAIEFLSVIINIVAEQLDIGLLEMYLNVELITELLWKRPKNQV